MSGDQYQPCSFCGMATPHSALATFGARCKPCFDAYCLERPKPPANPQGRQAAFMPRRPISWAADPDPDPDPEPVALPPAAPLPSVRAHLPEIAPAPIAATTDEPPEWATEA